MPTNITIPLFSDERQNPSSRRPGHVAPPTAVSQTKPGGAVLATAAPDVPSTLNLSECAALCNSVDSKHSSGYPMVLGRGEVFGSFTDTRGPCITSTLLPPATTTFVEADGHELTVNWTVVPSLTEWVAQSLGGRSPGGVDNSGKSSSVESPQPSATPQQQQPTGGGAPDLVNKVRSNRNILRELLTISATTNGGLPVVQQDPPSTSTTHNQTSDNRTEGAAAVAQSCTATSSAMTMLPRALIAVTTYQHTSIFLAQLPNPRVASTGAGGRGQTQSETPLPDIAQTWTIPFIGKRVTAQLVAFHAARVHLAPLASHSDIAGATSNGARGAEHSTSSAVTVAIEPVLIMGFERGDVLFCSIINERVTRRLNASNGPDPQIIPSACSCVVEIAAPAQAAVRNPLGSSLRSGAFASARAMSSVGSHPYSVDGLGDSAASPLSLGGSRTVAPAAAAAAPSRAATTTASSPSTPGMPAPTASQHHSEAVYALGFDDGSVLIVSLNLSSALATAPRQPSAPTGSPAVHDPLPVQLRHHVSFGKRPIRCIQPSLPNFMVQLWKQHDPTLRRNGGSGTIAQGWGSQASSRSSSASDFPLGAAASSLTHHHHAAAALTGSAKSAHSLLRSGSTSAGNAGNSPSAADASLAATTVVAAHLLYQGSQQEINDSDDAQHHGAQCDTTTRGFTVRTVVSPSYAAVTGECGNLYIVELPSFEKRAVSSSHDRMGECGEYNSLQWIYRSGTQHGSDGRDPLLLVAGGEGDAVDVFCVSELHQGQLRRVGAASPAWGKEQHVSSSPRAAPSRSYSGTSTGASTSAPSAAPLRCVLQQRTATIHRSFVNSLSAMYFPDADGCVLAVVSLDDTISFWSLDTLPGGRPGSSSGTSRANVGVGGSSGAAVGTTPQRPHSGHLHSGSHSRDALTPPAGTSRRPPALHHPHVLGTLADSGPSDDRPAAAFRDDPLLVLQRCHEDMVVAAATCDAGPFGSLWITLCLRGKVKIWAVGY